MSGLLGEGDKAQLLESYFWVGSAFRRAGPLGMEGSAFQRAGSLGVVEGEDKGGGSLEKEGAGFVVIGPYAYPRASWVGAAVTEPSLKNLRCGC